MYARVNLETGAVVASLYVLPERLAGYVPEILADLTFAGEPGFGLFPVIEGAAPTFDPAKERLADDVTPGDFDPASGTVPGVRAVLALTADELAARQAALLAFASDWRWQREVGGVMVGPILVATDDRSKILLAGARRKAELNADYVARWKVGDEDSVSIPAAQIFAMSDAQMDWVDDTFSAWDVVKDAIKAGILKTEADVVAAFVTALGQ